jgi:hypothetical protein
MLADGPPTEVGLRSQGKKEILGEFQSLTIAALWPNKGLTS